jgi:hypothetical protein
MHTHEQTVPGLLRYAPVICAPETLEDCQSRERRCCRALRSTHLQALDFFQGSSRRDAPDLGVVSTVSPPHPAFLSDFWSKLL